MTEQIEMLVSVATFQEWLSELPEGLRTDLGSADPLLLAERWSNSPTRQSINPFGGVGQSSSFWEAFRRECCRFLCGEEPYRAILDDLVKQGPGARAAIISVVGGAIAIKIGVMWALVSPIVVLLLAAVAKMGLEAVKARLCEDTASA